MAGRQRHVWQNVRFNMERVAQEEKKNMVKKKG